MQRGLFAEIRKRNGRIQKSLSQLDHGLEALSAMLNKSGHGKVAFDVLDNAEIEGAKDFCRETIKKIGTRIKGAIVPSILAKMLVLLNQNPSLTLSGLCELSGLSRSRITEIIRDLKNEKRIERVGANKSGYWRVLKK